MTLFMDRVSEPNRQIGRGQEVVFDRRRRHRGIEEFGQAALASCALSSPRCARRQSALAASNSQCAGAMSARGKADIASAPPWAALT
jgi:hypothetical protein